MVYRTIIHEATGYNPAKLMMGQELRTPINIIYGSPPQELNTK